MIIYHSRVLPETQKFFNILGFACWKPHIKQVQEFDIFSRILCGTPPEHLCQPHGSVQNWCTCYDIWLWAWHTMCQCHTIILASSLQQLHIFWVLLAHTSTHELLLCATWVGCHDVFCSWQLNTQLAGAWWGQVWASWGKCGHLGGM